MSFAVLVVAASIAGPPPQSMVVRFNDHALYGPIAAPAVLYPSDLIPPGHRVAESVEASFDPDHGPYLLRLVFDEALLPDPARPARVRVLRKALFVGWDPVPATLQRAPEGRHALFVRVSRPGHYAVVAGDREPPPFPPLLREAIGGQLAWLIGEGGRPAPDRLVGALKRAGDRLGADLGGVRLLDARAGDRAERLLHGLLDFFRLEKGPRPALVVGDTVWVTSRALLDPDVPVDRVQWSMARVGAEVLAQREQGAGRIDRWVELLARHGWKRHPMHQEIEARADRSLRR